MDPRGWCSSCRAHGLAGSCSLLVGVELTRFTRSGQLANVSDDMDQLSKALRSFGKLRESEPMSKHTTFKIGGPAQYFLTVDNVDKLPELLGFLDGEGIAWMMLGGGSNMLANDDGFDGVVIRVTDKSFSIDDEKVTAAAGMLTVALAQETVKAGLTGFEWGVGVPGTIGGAVRGNAGAMNGEMKDNVSSVDVYRDGEVVTLSNEECAFGYRDSIFKHRPDVVLRATLALRKGDGDEAKKKMMECIKYRNETQPKGFASTGCMFKNIDLDEEKETLFRKHANLDDEKVKHFLKDKRVPAGWLVEQVGMKGKQQGGAMVSDIHGNFIVNDGKATATEVQTLVDEIKQRVYDTYGLTLEEEIHLV